jgi:carbonic anhydrase
LTAYLDPKDGDGISRRSLLALMAGTALGLGAAERPCQAAPNDITGDQAIQMLIDGNKRFVGGKTRHAHQGSDWRKQLVAGQAPFATLLGCSDSRVPIELVFDQGFGDLFVIRVAGNIISPDVVGSMAYAFHHLHTPLFVVLGHEGCGAVTAALEDLENKAHEPKAIKALLKLIEDGMPTKFSEIPEDKRVEAAVEANVCWSLKQLKALPGVETALNEKRSALIGGVYDIDSGRVRLVDV